MNDFGSQNGAKMEGKILGLSSREASENGLEIQPRFLMVLGCLWMPLGTLFGAFWASWETFGLPQAAFWASWEPFGLRQAVFSAAFGSFSVRRELAEILTRTSENLQRFRREPAEVQPRIGRGSAENPPRTSREPAV